MKIAILYDHLDRRIKIHAKQGAMDIAKVLKKHGLDVTLCDNETSKVIQIQSFHAYVDNDWSESETHEFLKLGIPCFLKTPRNHKYHANRKLKQANLPVPNHLLLAKQSEYSMQTIKEFIHRNQAVFLKRCLSGCSLNCWYFEDFHAFKRWFSRHKGQYYLFDDDYILERFDWSRVYRGGCYGHGG